MIKILQSHWAAALVGMLLYLATTGLAWKPQRAVATTPPPATATAPASGPSWEFHNPEVDQLIAEMKQEKESLAKRDAQLKEFAERLQTERLEINLVLQAVQQLQTEFDNRVVRVTAEESANVKKLARTYAAMTPEGATPILKQMDETTLVKILATMKESETAPILEAMAHQGVADAKRVAAISERLRLSLSTLKDAKRAAP
jgi:flagellar motility protein MotE (MotC chaperone)